MRKEQINAINDAIFAGHKIRAIKLYRQATGHDLKASKEFIETLAAELQAQHPEKFTVKPGEVIHVGARHVIILILVIVIFLLVVKCVGR